MMFIAGLALTVLSISTTFAARLPITAYKGPVKAHSYVVVLKDSTDQDAHIKSLTGLVVRDVEDSAVITHTYDVINGYTAKLTGAALTHVLTSGDVLSVQEDGIVSITYEEEGNDDVSTAVERDLVDIEERGSLGSGVDIYGLDTGIYTAHTSFGGRASWGKTFGGYPSADGNGHGTHTAATAVGKIYGVATSAKVIAVKVLSDAGSGPYSDIIAGVNWVYGRYKSTRRPSIATMSLGGPAFAALDTAVANAIKGGLHFTLAAGNDAKDASSVSPARVTQANTIGAIDGATNIIAYFSNFGSIVDVFAPGVNILSAYIGGPNASTRLSGTSMATPYVAGLLAVEISKHGQATPLALSNALKSHAKAVVKGQPIGTTKLRAFLW